MEEIKNRSEILFLYEIENANPNGDPLNENRPRFDTEENKVLVSDVRLKRTIRDYWFEYKDFNGSNGKDIFVRETKYSDGKEEYISSGSRRAELFKESSDKVLETCIDVRVFGGVLPIKKRHFYIHWTCTVSNGKIIASNGNYYGARNRSFCLRG